MEVDDIIKNCAILCSSEHEQKIIEIFFFPDKLVRFPILPQNSHFQLKIRIYQFCNAFLKCFKGFQRVLRGFKGF